MCQQARITSPSGSLIVWVDANAPYDREVVLEHARRGAFRFGPVRVRIDRREWLVAPGIDDRQRCAHCEQELGRLVFSRQGYLLCSRCGESDCVHNEDLVAALTARQRKPALRKENVGPAALSLSVRSPLRKMPNYNGQRARA